MKLKSYRILNLDQYSKDTVNFDNYNIFSPCIVQNIKNTTVFSEIISFSKMHRNDMLS